MLQIEPSSQYIARGASRPEVIIFSLLSTYIAEEGSEINLGG